MIRRVLTVIHHTDRTTTYKMTLEEVIDNAVSTVISEDIISSVQASHAMQLYLGMIVDHIWQ